MYKVNLKFFGAAQEVGRSCILIESGDKKFLFDAGINLGEKGEGRFPKIPLKLIPKIRSIFLSHAHLDHSGYLPFLVKNGFSGKILCTKPTRDTIQLLLSDAARIGKEEGTAIYSSEDVLKTISLVEIVEYEKEHKLSKNVSFMFFNAGHIIGASMILLNIKGKKILYTGDFNTRETSVLLAAKNFPGDEKVDCILMESTYGNRVSLPSLKSSSKKLADLINETISKGGKVLIPVFAVGRAQEIMFFLENYLRSGYLKKLNVFLDGMLIRANRICRHNVINLKPEIINRILIADDDPFKSEFMQKSKTIHKRDVMRTENVVVLATSGMLTAGPSLTYFKLMAPNPLNAIVLVGFQVKGSLGRELIEGAKTVKIDENEIAVNANLVHIPFSAHSDFHDLINFAKGLKMKKIFLVHGEKDAVSELSKSLKKNTKAKIIVPELCKEYVI